MISIKEKEKLINSGPEAIQKAIDDRRNLLKNMAGQLYPPIVQEEIEELQKLLDPLEHCSADELAETLEDLSGIPCFSDYLRALVSVRKDLVHKIKTEEGQRRENYMRGLKDSLDILDGKIRAAWKRA